MTEHFMPDFEYIAQSIGLDVSNLLKFVYESGYAAGRRDYESYVNNGNINV